jgi:signal transduction histidine kinase
MAHDLTTARILRWRCADLPMRIGQILLIAPLCWLLNHDPRVVPWAAFAIATAVVDQRIARLELARPGDRRQVWMTSVSSVASSTAFALVIFIFGIHAAWGAMGSAMIVGCAAVLNNAVMTRGSRRFSLTLVAPSAGVLLALPTVVQLASNRMHWDTVALLTVGVAAYVAFIGRLSATLDAESAALTKALVAAEAANAAKSVFLTTVSHEIRTPLNGVLGMAQAMRADALSEPQRQRLDVIRQSGEALLVMLNDILDLSKIEAGKLELEEADFDLATLAASVDAVFAPAAKAKGVGFKTVIEPGVAGAWRGDPHRVRQILYNLLSNAVKFTETGEVLTHLSASDEGIRLEVKDTGVGIPDDRIDSLFTKFVQADSSITRRFGGAGLGLAICRELCTAMGGRIAIDSTLGVGSRFTVHLPLKRAAASPVADAHAIEDAAPLEMAPALRLLAAEDNPVNQLVLRTLLTQIGIAPTIVDNGGEAVAAWEAGDWDLILMDVQMPVMDGPTAARTIRAREAETGRAATPIIALTANAMSHQLDDYRAAGMNGLIAKPIDVATLIEVIVAAVDGRDNGDLAAA